MLNCPVYTNVTMGHSMTDTTDWVRVYLNSRRAHTQNLKPPARQSSGIPNRNRAPAPLDTPESYVIRPSRAVNLEECLRSARGLQWWYVIPMTIILGHQLRRIAVGNNSRISTSSPRLHWTSCLIQYRFSFSLRLLALNCCLRTGLRI